MRRGPSGARAKNGLVESSGWEIAYAPWPEGPEDQTPDEHHGAKQLADGIGALALHKKQARQNRHGSGDDVFFEAGVKRHEALGRAENGYGGRDHAVAEEQGGSDQNHDGADTESAFDARLSRFGAFVRKCEQGEDAALAAIVGPHDEGNVFEAYLENQRPEHQGENAEDPFGFIHVGKVVQALLHGVERAGADVSEYNAQGSETESDFDGRFDGRVSGGAVHESRSLSQSWT